MIPDGIGSWGGDLPFFTFDWPAVSQALAADTRQILPPPDETRFRALELTKPEDVRVVILGQDPPYPPTPGDANGLAFSVSPGTPLPPRSLKNIFAEIETDLGYMRSDGDLSDWARQGGVLLLNTSLSVPPAGAANAHKTLGWDRLVQEVLDHVSKRPTAFILWGGNNAQKLGKHINSGGDHLMVETAHPSPPLSARRGFFGSRPFSRVNEWLTTRHEPAIDW